MAVKFEIVAVTGKYTASDGTEKNRYTKLGVVIEGERGLRAKFEAIPVGWDGWCFFSEPKPRDGAASAAKAAKPAAKAQKPADDFDDDLPF